MDQNSIDVKKRLYSESFQDKFLNKLNKSIHQVINLNNSIINKPKYSKIKFEKAKISDNRIINSKKIKKPQLNKHNRSYEEELGYNELLIDDSISNNRSIIIQNKYSKKNKNNHKTRNTYYLNNQKLLNKLNIFDFTNNEIRKKNSIKKKKPSNKNGLNNTTLLNPNNQTQINEKGKIKLGNIIKNFETISFNEISESYKKEKKFIINFKNSSVPNSTLQSKKNSKARTNTIDLKNVLINSQQMSNNSTTYTKKNEENSFISSKNVEIKNDDILEKDKSYSTILFESFLKSVESNEFDYSNNPEEHFTELKNDFFLFYTDDYLNNIQEDLLKLELELIIEKVFELIMAYHSQIRLMIIFQKNNKHIYKECESNYFSLEKKMKKLQKIKSYKQLSNQNMNIIKKNYLKEQSIMLNLNLNEFQIVKDFFPPKKLFKKEKLKEIFYKILNNKNNISLISNDNLKNWIKSDKNSIKIDINKTNNFFSNISGNFKLIKPTRDKNMIKKKIINPFNKTHKIFKNTYKKIQK